MCVFIFLQLTPLGGSLVETRFSNTSMGAALNLLSISIPGVPVIRSGDEVGASSPVLTWEEASDPDVSLHILCLFFTLIVFMITFSLLS